MTQGFTTRLVASAVALALAGITTVLPASAHARARWPVIGCNNLNATYADHSERKYKPSGLCQTGGRLGTTTGIDGAHWTHWGRSKATARGFLIDGLGFEYPATITAYRLQHTNHLDGIAGDFASWYARLHVVSKAEVRGGVKRGPYRVTLNSVPGS